MYPPLLSSPGLFFSSFGPRLFLIYPEPSFHPLGGGEPALPSLGGGEPALPSLGAGEPALPSLGAGVPALSSLPPLGPTHSHCEGRLSDGWPSVDLLP